MGSIRIKVLAAILIGSFSSQAVASTTALQLQLRTNFSPKALSVDNQDGVWFPDEDAEYLLKLRTDIVPDLMRMVEEQQKAISGLDTQLQLNLDKDKLQDEKVQVLQKSLDASQQELRACLDGADHWYTNKYVWGIAGFVAGILLTGYIARSVK